MTFHPTSTFHQIKIDTSSCQWPDQPSKTLKVVQRRSEDLCLDDFMDRDASLYSSWTFLRSASKMRLVQRILEALLSNIMSLRRWWLAILYLDKLVVLSLVSDSILNLCGSILYIHIYYMYVLMYCIYVICICIYVHIHCYIYIKLWLETAVHDLV